MDKIRSYISQPKYIALGIGIILSLALIVWFIRRIRRNPAVSGAACGKAHQEKESIFAAAEGEKAATTTIGAAAQRNVADVGRDTVRLTESGAGIESLPTVSLNLPAPAYGSQQPAAVSASRDGGALGTDRLLTPEQVAFLGTTDVNVDPRVQAQWAQHEIPFQTNTSQPPGRSGQVWVQNWEALGPIDPFAPRGKDGQFIGGPSDPQTQYGMSIAAALNGQAAKFCVTENPNDVTYQYRNSLQQLPGSHFQVEAASFDPYETPQVVNRFAQLPEMAARWVVAKMNDKIRAEHPCFSLSGREHFEQSFPPANCGDVVNQKHDPITLIRIVECRIKRVRGTEDQLIYLWMEIGNHITGGAGGAYNTVVTVNNKGEFVSYTAPQRDQHLTFVLPRSRT